MPGKANYHVLREIEVEGEKAYRVVATIAANGEDQARRLHLDSTPDDAANVLVVVASFYWHPKRAKLKTPPRAVYGFEDA